MEEGEGRHGETGPVLTAHQEWIKRETARRLRREMTPTEKRLWQHLRANRLVGLRFYRQQIIDGFIADFYCDASSLVVEVDGGIHETQVEYDAERTRIFSERGLLTLSFSNTQVETDAYAVTKAIRAATLPRLPSAAPVTYRRPQGV